MHTFEISEAKREKQKLLLSMAGVTNSGKTLSSLLIAYGMMKEAYPELSESDVWRKIGVVDTEHERAALYENREFHGVRIGPFIHLKFPPPYSTERYQGAVEALKERGVELVIVDSLSHNWNGEGGTLSKHGSMSGNSFQNWNKLQSETTELVNVMTRNNIHLIATMRVKTEYVMELNDKGKQQPRKVGLKPIQKDDVDYEFTTQFMIDADHLATATKDNTGLFETVEDESFTITPSLGAELYRFLEKGVDVNEERKAEAEKQENERRKLLTALHSMGKEHAEVSQLIAEFEFKTNVKLVDIPYDLANKLHATAKKKLIEKGDN